MKHTLLFGAIAMLLLLASCKKQQDGNGPVPNSNPVTFIPTDTASFTFNGKQYTGNTTGVFVAGNQQVNITLDPVDKLTQHGNADSVLYYRTYTIYKTGDASISLSFVKKYAKAQLHSDASSFLSPSNPPDLFTTGQHPFAFDFNRENTQNGIAIQVGNGALYTTYSQLPLNVKTTLTAASQSNSKFEVTSLTKLANGAYILEAKFSATVFDMNENAKKLDNGYLKIHVY